MVSCSIRLLVQFSLDKTVEPLGGFDCMEGLEVIYESSQTEIVIVGRGGGALGGES